MRTKYEILETMQMLQPYLQRIAKDLDKDMTIQLSVVPNGLGWAILYEQSKNIQYQHFIPLSEDCVATDVKTEHRFIDGLETQYHQDIENQWRAAV